jgi:excisionase family DNA binding protein
LPSPAADHHDQTGEELKMNDRYTLSIKETRKALGLGRTTIYKLLAAGQLDRVKAGTRTLVTVSSIKRLLAAVVAEGAR